MSINQDQFEKLSAMGISLWQSRVSNNEAEIEKNIAQNYLEVDLALLCDQQLFTDILLSAGLSIGEVKQQGDHLDLGLFNWFFMQASDTNEKHTVKWLDQQLFTPALDEISQSSTLKRQLWQLLRDKT